MRIPEETIEAIRAAVDIVEVVGEYVSLRRRGANWFGLCPFHEEKTPSFSVNPQLGIFKCFGCGRGGDVFAFIQQIEHVSQLCGGRADAGRTRRHSAPRRRGGG